MNCIAIVNSGNYAITLCRILEQKGYVFEVISTPCSIAREGCGYCLKFPEEFLNIVLNQASLNKIAINETFRIVPMVNKNKYEKII